MVFVRMVPVSVHARKRTLVISQLSKKVFFLFRPADADITHNTKGNFEHLNKDNCGVSRVRFVLGGQKAPEGAFPFIVSFTQVIIRIIADTILTIVSFSECKQS